MTDLAGDRMIASVPVLDCVATLSNTTGGGLRSLQLPEKSAVGHAAYSVRQVGYAV